MKVLTVSYTNRLVLAVFICIYVIYRKIKKIATRSSVNRIVADLKQQATS